MERKDSGFNQTEFNKILLENVMKTQFTVSKLLAIGSLSPHVTGDERFEFRSMVSNIREDAKMSFLTFSLSRKKSKTRCVFLVVCN